MTTLLLMFALLTPKQQQVMGTLSVVVPPAMLKTVTISWNNTETNQPVFSEIWSTTNCYYVTLSDMSRTNKPFTPSVSWIIKPDSWRLVGTTQGQSFVATNRSACELFIVRNVSILTGEPSDWATQ